VVNSCCCCGRWLGTGRLYVKCEAANTFSWAVLMKNRNSFENYKRIRSLVKRYRLQIIRNCILMKFGFTTHCFDLVRLRESVSSSVALCQTLTWRFYASTGPAWLTSHTEYSSNPQVTSFTFFHASCRKIRGTRGNGSPWCKSYSKACRTAKLTSYGFEIWSLALKEKYR
jgi:hypothetical protein